MEKSQVININFSYGPLSVDPRKCLDPVTITLNYMLYEGLTRIESDGTVCLATAEKVKISKDKKEYFFYLREATWSDGSPLTAYHFEKAWKKVLSPSFSSKSAHLFFPLKKAKQAKQGKCLVEEVGVKAIDEKTLAVYLEKPVPYFLELTAHPAYFPVFYNGDEVPYPNQKVDLISNGPFLLNSWKNENEITVVKNPFYWNAKDVNLEKIQISILNDEAASLNLFEKGELDFIGGLISPIPIDAMKSLEENPNLWKRPIAGTTLCVFNVERYPFNNMHIRKAFAYAIDRKQITENISQMFDDPASGLVPPVLKKTATTLFEDQQKRVAQHHFNLGLQELGITKEELPTITYHYFASELQKKLALALQSYWKDALGITVELQTMDLKNHLAKLYARDFIFAQISWIAQYHDRMSFLERFNSKDDFRNYGGWENVYFSDLLTDSYIEEKEKRERILEEAEHLFIDEMPVIPLYHFQVIYMKNPKLKNLAVSPMGDIQFHQASFIPDHNL